MATAKENQKRIEQIERDVVKLGTDVAVIKNDIQTIKTNHLAHIESDMKKLDMRLWWVVSLLIASIVIPFLKTLW